MAYDTGVLRANVEATLPDPVANEIIKAATSSSMALALFRKIRMSTATQRLPVLSALPTAYWVTGDDGYKQTTHAEWDKVVLEPEELAVIVPIPEKVLDDTQFDVWAEIRPLLVEAMAVTLDAAVFFGLGSPFPQNVQDHAEGAGNDTTIDAAQSDGGIAQDFNELMAEVEDDGYDVSGFAAKRSLRPLLRGARDTSGQRLLDVQSVNEIEGLPVRYGLPGPWPDGIVCFAGDFTKGIIGIRQDFTYKMLDQAVIQDQDGTILYNLPQQDMVALRLVFRAAFAIANPVNREEPTDDDRSPFATLAQAS